MPRIQILELPEGTGDDRPPFALVIDQAPRSEPLFAAFRNDIELNDAIAGRVGARAVLIFEDTVDIPANEVTLGADGLPLRVRVEPDLDEFSDQVAAAIVEARAQADRAAAGGA